MRKAVKTAIGALAVLAAVSLSGYGAMRAIGADDAKGNVIVPAASGEKVKENDSAIIDYSNVAQGYVMVQYKKETDEKLKAQVKTPNGLTYTYTLLPKEWAAFPLTEGDGKYKITVYRNVSGSSYATECTKTVKAELEDEMLPFLTANQYVNYTEDTKCVQEAAEVCQKAKTELEKVEAVYEWTMKKFSYSKIKAKTVKSGYVPDLDEVFKARKGICFDYASTMVAMLRSQGVPTKLVIGYSGTVYHAWLNVYTEESGWVSGVVYFDGEEWSLMDPTFADTAKSDEEFKEYIGDASNYVQKYVY